MNIHRSLFASDERCEIDIDINTAYPASLLQFIAVDDEAVHLEPESIDPPP